MIAVRSYLTAGVAVVGAAAIVLPPVPPAPVHLAAEQQRVVSDMAVSLAAVVDPIQLWRDTLQTASGNLSDLITSYAERPLPILSSIVSNQLTYIEELPDLGAILGQIGANFQTFFAVQQEPNTDTLDFSHNLIYKTLGKVGLPPEVLALVDLTTTWSSGQLLSFIAPPLAATIALVDSIRGIAAAPDFDTALNEIINIPANQVNAFLNGGKSLDLTALVGLLPPIEGLTILEAGVALGGLLSPGGSILNSLTIGIEGIKPQPIPGVDAGVIGSSIELGKQIGEAILVPPPAPAAEVGVPPAAQAVDVEVAVEPAADEASLAADVPTPVEESAPAANASGQATAAAPQDDSPKGSGARAPRHGRGS